MKLELKQKKLFSAERHFLFKDNTTLNIVYKTLKNHKEYAIDIVALDTKLRNHFIFAIKPLIGFVVFLNLSLVLYLTPSLDFLVEEYKNWLVLAALILSLVFVILFLVFTQYERIFVARHTKLPLVRFYNGLPNKKEFKRFIAAIQAQSQQRFEFLDLKLQQQCAGELKTIRRIHEQGGISASEYEAAKDKLLKFANE